MEYHHSSLLLHQSSALQISLKILSLIPHEIISKLIESENDKETIRLLILKSLTSDEKHIHEIRCFLSSISFNSFEVPDRLSPINTLLLLLIHFHLPELSKTINLSYKSLDLECNKICLLHSFFYLKEFNSLCDTCIKIDKGQPRPVFFNICLKAEFKDFISESKLETFENVARRPEYSNCDDIVECIEKINDDFLEFLRSQQAFFPGDNCSNCRKSKKQNEKKNNRFENYELKIFIVQFEWRGIEVNEVEVLIALISICFSFGVDRIFEKRSGIYELKIIVFMKRDQYYYLDVENAWNEPSGWQNLIQYLVFQRFCPVNLIYRKVELFREGIKLDTKIILKILKLAVQIKWFSLTAACNNMHLFI